MFRVFLDNLHQRYRERRAVRLIGDTLLDALQQWCSGGSDGKQA